jgi:type VI secretion system protein ImpC
MAKSEPRPPESAAKSVVLDAPAQAYSQGKSVYESLCEKINLTPVMSARPMESFQSVDSLSESSLDERVARALQVFLKLIGESSQLVDRLDKSLIDHHMADLDRRISQQLDAILHHETFQRIESTWRGLKFLVDRTDFRRNVQIEVLDVSKDALREDFEDTPEVIQSGFYRHTYIQEYDTPGGYPIGSVISNYEFDRSPQDIALLRNISKVSAAAHMPFIASASPKFFGKESMEEVASIRDIGNYFDRAEYLKWKSFRESDDARYIGLTMPRFLARLPYGPETLPVRDFNYKEAVKGPDHSRYLWANASFAFAANMVRSFVDNGWCVQIRGPQAGGRVVDLPIHLYDLGTGAQAKIPTEVLIPETREFEFANLGFIPLSYYKNHDHACFFSAHSTQKPAVYETTAATANSRVNARLPYIFLLSRIAHYLKLIQRENIGTTKDRRVLELELNTWVKTLVTEMTDPGDSLQASHPLRDAKVTVEDIEDNPGYFRVKLFIVPHFQIEGMDLNLSLVSQMPKAKS